MINTHTNIERPYWIVEHDNIIHYGILEAGQQTSSNHEIITFDNEQDWKDYLQNNFGILAQVTNETE